MKAIIIQDSDARALVDALALVKLRPDAIGSALAGPTTIDEVHRAFHYVVVRWLQEQGASITK